MFSADEVVVAAAYGYTLPADTGWWDDVLEPVPDEVSREDGKRSFAVFEFGVDPGRRREHLGERVHQALIPTGSSSGSC